MPCARRCLDHLHAELSVALDRRLPRYELWLRLQLDSSLAARPTRGWLERFVRMDLGPLLEHFDATLSPRRRRRLERRLLCLDPRYPTPEERLARLGTPGTPSGRP